MVWIELSAVAFCIPTVRHPHSCCSQAKAAKEATKPVVAWVDYNDYEPASYEMSFAQYKADFTEVPARFPNASIRCHTLAMILCLAGQAVRFARHQGHLMHVNCTVDRTC